MALSPPRCHGARRPAGDLRRGLPEIAAVSAASGMSMDRPLKVCADRATVLVPDYTSTHIIVGRTHIAA